VRGREAQVMDVLLSQLQRERLARGDVPSQLLNLKNPVVELDDVAETESRRWRWKHKEDVIAALSRA
jgi:hypothetical protein